MAALLSDTYQEKCLWQAQAAPPEVARPPLPATADVVVIGAGYCGLAAAESASVAGASVVVLDREPLGWGASSRNGGMVIPELKAGPQTLETKYGPLGALLYDDVNTAFDWTESQARGMDCDYRRSGQLYLSHSARHDSHLQELAMESDATFLHKSELAEEIGSDAFTSAVLFERVGSLHPAKYHAAWARRAMTAGASILDRTAATGVGRSGTKYQVTTTRGTVEANDVIVATNASVDAAVPGLARRVQPIGSYIIATEVLPADVAASVSPRGRMMVDTKNLLFYWRLTPDNRMAFGGRDRLDPVDIPAARDLLYDAMIRIHPQLTGYSVAYAWGGVVAMTVDRLPHVGRLDGAWYATGCNGTGVSLNAWLGHRLGEVVTGQAPPPAFYQLKHRRIPARRMSSSYLPLVGRWFAWRDRR